VNKTRKTGFYGPRMLSLEPVKATCRSHPEPVKPTCPTPNHLPDCPTPNHLPDCPTPNHLPIPTTKRKPAAAYSH
jgi:hypothetical protein